MSAIQDVRYGGCPLWRMSAMEDVSYGGCPLWRRSAMEDVLYSEIFLCECEVYDYILVKMCGFEDNYFQGYPEDLIA